MPSHRSSPPLPGTLPDTEPAPGAQMDAQSYAFTFGVHFQPTAHTACNETGLWLRGGAGADGRPYLDADLTVVNRCRHDPAHHFLLNAYFRTNSFELKADPGLDTATLTGTLPVVACNGELCAWVGQHLNVEIELTSNGELAGDPRRALSRPVVATGTVAGRWENFTPTSSVEGYLSRLNDEP